VASRFASREKSAAPPLSQLAFLWPAVAAASAGDFAWRVATEFANLSVEWNSPPRADKPPPWTTPHKIALELSSARLLNFSTASDGTATLVCAPFALHGPMITDLAPGHSLVAALLGAGLQRVLVTDWRSATPEMRFFSIDTYLADLNVMVDQLGGTADLIGLCQGGWMALTYAARFPQKVRKLVLAGAPIDIAAGESVLSRRAKDTPLVVFEDLVSRGGGRVSGRQLLQCWNEERLESGAIGRLLQVSKSMPALEFRRLEARFREWYSWTLDLPGTYYLEVVERLFKENQLAAGRFVALGQRVDVARVRAPVFLLAARDDEIVAPEQVFATEYLARSRPRKLCKATAAAGHLGLFLGRGVLSDEWTRIARWLRERP
jgi:poly(3-hydroxybutyrate) depolymerase